MQAMSEEEAIPVDSGQHPWNSLTLERKLRWNQCAVIRKETGKMNVLNGPETPDQTQRSSC
jgi:hypothetical protein